MTTKTYRSTIEVRGYELDSFGHVNNAVYLNYLEYARWKMLEKEGITLDLIQKEKLWPVISAIEIKYLRPSFMGDQLEIRSRIVESSKARFQIEQLVFRGETQIAAAKVYSVVVNENGRPVEIPSAYLKLWEE
jgi:YbgC/YbaW family acyl-CoA thioester hydrolase